MLQYWYMPSLGGTFSKACKILSVTFRCHGSCCRRTQLKNAMHFGTSSLSPFLAKSFVSSCFLESKNCSRGFHQICGILNLKFSKNCRIMSTTLGRTGKSPSDDSPHYFTSSLCLVLIPCRVFGYIKHVSNLFTCRNFAL